MSAYICNVKTVTQCAVPEGNILGLNDNNNVKIRDK